MQLFMMEKPCEKEKALTLPSSTKAFNGDDEYNLELNEDEINQLFQSIDDIMCPGNTTIETDITNNQSNTLQDLSNATTAFLEDFEEFEKSNLPACGRGDTSIDASVLHDFETFEKTMLPPISYGNMDSISINGGEEDVKEMVNEMADDGDEAINFINGGEEDAKEMVNEMADNGDETINFIVEEDVLLTFDFDDEYEFGGGVNGGGGVDPFLEPQGGPKTIHYIKCSGDTGWQPENGSWRRKKEMRKYRGVIETAEQTAKRLAITKIKNRVAASRAYEKRREYDAFLEAQLQKLRWKNKYLKNLVKFLECHNREHMQLQALRRTSSGLI